MRNYSKILQVFAKERDSFKDSTLNVSAKDNLSYESVVGAAFGNVDVSLDQAALDKTYEYVKQITEGNEAVYGITTSFGGNIKNAIPSSKTHLLQHNLITSHRANVGTYLPYEVCKGAVLLRLITVTKGYSGISNDTAEFIRNMLKVGLVPAIQAHGSMGASGDLGPLSAAAACLLGEGVVYLPDRTTVVPTKEAFAKFGIEPISLKYREGLALINGTSVMTSVSSFYLWHLRRLIENSLVVSALSVQALRGSKEPFDARLHNLKPHTYQINTAKVMSSLLDGSKLARSHAELKADVEEALKNDKNAPKSKTDLQGGSYSIRAIPQIYQPILALYELFKQSVNTEINAVDDNPLMLPDEGDELHGANFHGHPISVPADALNTSLLSIANVSNSRIDRMLKSHHSDLPAFLGTGQEGLYLGMQGIQYTAAGICAELRGLAYPLSVNQVTTNNDNQDLVSFGLQATLKGTEIMYLVSYVLAVEYVSAVQALWLRIHNQQYSIDSLSPATREAYESFSSIYEPQENTDQSLLDAVEQASERLLLTSLLPGNLKEDLWKN